MKKLFVIVVLVLVALGAWWYRGNRMVVAPAGIGSVDTIADVDKTLDGLDTADLDKEFKEIDAATSEL